MTRDNYIADLVIIYARIVGYLGNDEWDQATVLEKGRWETASREERKEVVEKLYNLPIRFPEIVREKSES